MAKYGIGVNGIELFNGYGLDFEKRKSHPIVRLTDIKFSWQGIADALQTAALAASEDYKLKDLAETFQLSGSLLGT